MNEEHNLTVHQAVEQPKPEKKKQWNILTSKDFNGAPIEEVLPIIDGLLYPGLAQLGSPPKFGKSYLALDVAISIATGTEFLGRKIVRQGQVLYIDLEGKKSRTQRRLLNMGIRNWPENFEILYRDSKSEIRSIDNGFITQLSEEWLSKHDNPVLVIIDMWRGISGRPSKNETEYDAASRMMGAVQSFALQKNICVLILLHTRKGNSFKAEPNDVFEEFIGTTGQFATADCAWAITGKRTEPHKLFSVICRDNDKGEESLDVTFENFRYHLNGTREEIEKQQEQIEYENNPLTFTVRRKLEESETWSATSEQIKTEVVAQTGQCLTGYISKYLKQVEYLMRKYDGIEVVKPPVDGGNKGRPYTFRKKRPK